MIATSQPVHWTTYAGAAGPFVAAAAALWIAGSTHRRERAERPQLSLIYHEQSDDFHSLTDPLRGQHWVRMRIANERGKRTAEDVEVLLIGLETFNESQQMNGYPFVWSNSPDRPTRLTIPAGVARSFDLLSIREPLASDSAGGHVSAAMPGSPCHARLELRDPPATSRTFLGPGRHTLGVVITARNADATYYSIDIDYDGAWWPAPDIHQHLRIDEPRIIHT